ncbi:Adaptor for signal transduction [Dissophora globulifera]|nr:Adaptor for signal transduction [Dissophora globulifera]
MLENGISGDLLIHLDHAALKDLSIWEVGKRLVILNSIYHLKVSYGISLEAGDYVPPSVAFENEYSYQAAASLKSVEQAMHNKDNTIQHLVREVERMSKDLTKVKEELWTMQKDHKPLPEPSPGYPKTMNGQSSMLTAAQSNHGFNAALGPQSPVHASHLANSVRSPGYSTDSGFHSIPSSPHSPADIRGRGVNVDMSEDGKGVSSPGVDGAGAIKVYGQKPSSTRDPVDAFRSFRISQDDPCYKVLPAALKKYKINDDWRQYALFICYGNTERILTYNEKPLLLMKQLKEAKESPVFMLKHIKQMKSPAVNAAAPPHSYPPPRKSSDLMNKELPTPPESMAGMASLGSNMMGAHSNLNGGSSLARSGTTTSIRTSSKTAASMASASTTPTSLGPSSTSTLASATAGGINIKVELTPSNSTIVGPKPDNYVQETVEASGTAVALYEWEAKRDDELNVKVGDVFKIKSKGHGWWIVQRDDEIGWIPASILSENNAEDGYFSAEGVAIFDFAKTAPNELSIKTGDKLAAPVLDRSQCVGGQCNQAVQSGNVDIGSSTNIVPVTQVTPITRYQPIVQAYAPIVDSECSGGDASFFPSLYGGKYGYGSFGYSPYGYFPHHRYNMHPRPSMDMMPGFMGGAGLVKRRNIASMKENCVPSATETCEQNVPGSSTNLGSYVTAEPSNVVLPSTVYQGHVQSQAADIEAAAAQHTTLSHSNVDIGSHTYIQPVTKVLPQTTYQPSVDQKATVIDAAAPEHESLARSSVSLGSSVTVRPTTKVEPLTVYQPSIQSLPFLILDESCD